MDAIGINLPGLITQLVSFLILFFILSKLLYGPISKALMSDRIGSRRVLRLRTGRGKTLRPLLNV